MSEARFALVRGMICLRGARPTRPTRLALRSWNADCTFKVGAKFEFCAMLEALPAVDAGPGPASVAARASSGPQNSNFAPTLKVQIAFHAYGAPRLQFSVD